MNADLVLTETAASNAGAGVPMMDAARDTDLTLTQPAPCAVPAAGAFVSLIEGGQPMFEGQSQSDVEALLKSNPEFRQLYHRHRELDKQVLDAELGVLPIDDTTLARMKKEKLHAKDRLTRMFAAHHRTRH